MANSDDFYQFLNSYNCFENFCVALDEQHATTFNDLMRDSKDSKDLIKIIDYSITWDETHEGSDYWSSINYDWTNSCKTGIFIRTGLNCNNIWER
jgi:hypothetical protein